MTTFLIVAGLSAFGVAFATMSVIFIAATAHMKQLEMAAKGEEQ